MNEPEPDTGVRYWVTAQSPDCKRYAMINMNGEFQEREAKERGRNAFRVDERGKTDMEAIFTLIKANPEKYALPANSSVNMSAVIGSFSTHKTGLRCPQCDKLDLNLCWEGRCIDTNKSIHVERCGSCYYSDFMLVDRA